MHSLGRDLCWVMLWVRRKCECDFLKLCLFKWARDFSSSESRNLTWTLKHGVLQGGILAYSNVLPLSWEYVNFRSFFSCRVKIYPECHEDGLHEKRIALDFNNVFQCLHLNEGNWTFKCNEYATSTYYFTRVNFLKWFWKRLI